MTMLLARMRMRHHHLMCYVFVCVVLLCISSSSLIPTVFCAGSSGILVDPNNPYIPLKSDFLGCQPDTRACDGYYCPNGGSCSQQICIGFNFVRDIQFPDVTAVPSCTETTKMETTKVLLTAAISITKSPVIAIQNLGAECKVANQMVVLQTTRSSKDLNTIIPEGVDKNAYQAYDVEVGFFYQARPDDPLYKVVGTFVTYVRARSISILDSPNLLSNDGSIGVLVNTSDIQETAATFIVQRCSDGTAVVPPQTCPPDDPALTATSTTVTTTSETTRLLTIIAPIVGGVVAIVLIIAMILIIRRRRANKVMRQTVQHTEMAQPTMP